MSGTLTIEWRTDSVGCVKSGIFKRINKTFRRLVGKKMPKSPYHYESNRGVEVFRNVSSTENARKILGKRRKDNIKKATYVHLVVDNYRTVKLIK